MQFAVSELIRGARVYVDDDHDDEDAWLDDTDWLRLFNVEYAALYPKWVRAGLITPPFVDAPLTATSTAISNVLAIAGVAKLEDGRYCELEHVQPRLGRSPFLDTRVQSQASGWLAHGTGDNLTVELTPPPSDNTGSNYVVRYITRPNYLTSVADTIELPYGADERIVLGLADRAGIKSRDVSRKVMEKIQDADASLAFLIAGRGDGPRVRRVGRAPLRNDRFAAPFSGGSRYWTYF